MASVVPYMDASRPATADPRRLLQALQDFSCTNMFASPALIDKLGRYCTDAKMTLPTLRRAISAGAPASLRAIERFSRLLDGDAELFTPYGATEALPVASIGHRELLGETRALSERGAGICVGHRCEEIDVAIIPISDEPIASWSETCRLSSGKIGEIVVSGPIVTERYYGRTEATALAKIVDPQTGRIWHRMGDIGLRDEQGRLWMCGRKSHRVEASNRTLHSVACERVFDSHPQVRRTALVGVTRKGKTVPVLCVELEAGVGRKERASITRALAKRAAGCEVTRPIRTFLYHSGFPVDVRHNAKIGREKLAIWAQGKLS
jgi:acyl-CoA synthetase (AMP-forming)/AMP-acid ligase II